MKRLVPRDAVHHLELLSGREDRKEPSGEAFEPAEARIVYRAFDPVHPERRFQLAVALGLIDELLDRDTGGVIDIGGGKFVFADDVENARALVPRNIARIARCEAQIEPLGQPYVSIIELSDGAIIPSPFPVHAVEGMVQRPLPSAFLPPFRYDAYREAGPSA